MDEKVARANIEHYQLLLKTEIDDIKRGTVTRLLAEEQEKLVRVVAAKKGKPTNPSS